VRKEVGVSVKHACRSVFTWLHLQPAHAAAQNGRLLDLHEHSTQRTQRGAPNQKRGTSVVAASNIPH